MRGYPVSYTHLDVYKRQAFAVSAAFVFGDHLGFTAGVNSEMIFPMIVGKLTAGITALIVANILAPKLLSKVEASVKAAEKEE